MLRSQARLSTALPIIIYMRRAVPFLKPPGNHGSPCVNLQEETAMEAGGEFAHASNKNKL
jgi:hypothetical protein